MYISAASKESLRPYAGRSVGIDAREVDQPMNPGDGLITQYFINEVDLPANPLEHAGLVIRVSIEGGQSGGLRLQLQNQGTDAINVSVAAIGFAVLAKTSEGERPPFDPSDGSSTAVITRHDLEQAEGSFSFTLGEITRNYEWRVSKSDRLPSNLHLTPNSSRSTLIHLKLPPGEYQAIAGASDSVLQSSPLVSEAVNFDVGSSGQIVSVH